LVLENSVLGHPVLGHSLTGHPRLGHTVLGHPVVGHPVMEHTALGHPVLGNSVTRHPSLGHTVLGYPVLEHTVLGHPVLEHTVLGHPVLEHTVLGHPVLEHTFLGHPVPKHTVLGHSLRFVLPGYRLKGVLLKERPSNLLTPAVRDDMPPRGASTSELVRLERTTHQPYPRQWGVEPAVSSLPSSALQSSSRRRVPAGLKNKTLMVQVGQYNIDL